MNRSVKPLQGSTLREAMALPTDDARLELLYLRTLSRLPRDDERAAWLAYVNGATGWPKGKARREAFEDVLWALLNSSEFQLNH